MKITVTQQMIANGIRTDCFRCPLALAFKAAGFDVMVGPAQVDFYDATGDTLGSLRLPDIARQFQIRFDDGKPVEPFAFEMPGLTFPVSAIRFPQSPSVAVV